MKRSALFLLYGGVAALAATWFTIAPAVLRRGPSTETPQYKAPTPPPRAVPDFQLTDQHGSAVTLADLRGKVWLANFFFSTCPGPCLDLTRRMREIDRALGDRDDVRLLTFSIDPRNDTPEVLAAYAKKHEASPRWLFLAGERAPMARLANEGFMLALSADPAEFTHSEKLVVVDGDGKARAWIHGHAPDASTQALKALDEVRSGVRSGRASSR